MKRLFILTVVALAALASCTKETQVDSITSHVKKYIDVTVSADREPDTKTVINVPNKTLLWGDEEYLAVYEIRWEDSGVDGYGWYGDAVISQRGVSGDGGHTMTFEALFEQEANTSGEPLKYTAVYPASSVVGMHAGVLQTINLSSIQDDEEGSFDPDADILYATPQAFDDQQTDLHFGFNRLVALTRVKVKNIDPSCYQVSCVKLVTPNHVISGQKTLTLTNGSLSDPGTSQDLANSVKVRVKDRNLLSGSNSAPTEFDVWFCMWPTTLNAGETFSLVVTDVNGREFTRNVTISGAPLKFEAGRVTKFSVDMSSATSTTMSSYYRNIQFTSGNPMSGLNFTYKDQYKTGIRFYSYSDWDIKITGGDGWLTISNSYYDNGHTHVCGKGCGTNQSSTIQLVPNLLTKNISEGPRVATVTVSNDTDEKSFTITQDYYCPITDVAFSKSHYEVYAGQTITFDDLIVTPAAASQYTLYLYATPSGHMSTTDDPRTLQANVVGEVTLNLTAYDEVGRNYTPDRTATLSILEPDYHKPATVYMAMTDRRNGLKAFVVANGVETQLEGMGASTYGIVVAGDDVYVTGRHTDYVNDEYVNHACYWKNGAKTVFSDYDDISDPVLDGNDVYAIAHWCDPDTYDHHYYILKNWEKIGESAPPASWNHLAVENGDWYVAGYSTSSNMVTTYWKNGEKLGDVNTLTVKCIAVKNGKLYLGGSAYNKRPDAAVWADGTLTSYTSNTRSTQNDSIDILAVDDNNNVWAMGAHWYQSSTNVPYCYKNGKKVFMPTLLKDNGNQLFDQTELITIQFYDGLPYVLGSVSQSTNVFVNPMQILWSTLFYVPTYVNEEVQRPYQYSYGGLKYSGLFLK